MNNIKGFLKGCMELYHVRSFGNIYSCRDIEIVKMELLYNKVTMPYKISHVNE